MLARFCALALVLCVAAPSWAHFVFVVPEPGGAKAKVLMSEDLDPDEDVKISTIAGLKLSLRDAAGVETPLTMTEAEHAYSVDLGKPTRDVRVVRGDVILGVQQRGQSPAFLLTYHPKTILGDALDAKSVLGDKAPAEIVPVGKPGAVKFRVLSQGKPAAGLEVNFILPDGASKKSKTDAEGLTEAFATPGRYGAWVRCPETKSGDHDGKPYTEIRHYPTLVADLSAPVSSPYPKLPEPTSSFGAAAADGYLYVYGGHIAKTHSYDTKAVSGKFHRIKLAGGTTWEPLPDGPAMQGMNIASHNGKIYRVGGMEPRNAPGTKADNYSRSDVVRFDPATGKWENLPALPEPRSSHDVAFVGDKLIVVGGWNMKGREEGEDWVKNTVILDLSAAKPEWKIIEQPWERRALIAAVVGAKIYVIGGFTEHSKPQLRVDILDTATNTWSTGPEIPGPALNGFAPAACTIGNELYVSAGDGSLNRLDEKAGRWVRVATTTPRIVHRLIPHDGQILVVGGADKGQNLDLIEVVRVKPADEKSPAQQAAR